MTRRGRGGAQRAAPRAKPSDTLRWPGDEWGAVLTALGAAGAGGALNAARMVTSSRRLNSRLRRGAADLLFALARMEPQLDARVRFSTGLALPDLPAALLHRWRLGALLVTHQGQDVAQVAQRLDLAHDALARAAGEEYLAQLEGVERLAMAHAMPVWLTQRLVDQRGHAFADGLLEAMNQRAPMCVRARDDVKTLASELAAQDVLSVPARFSPWGLQLAHHINVRSLDAYKNGRLEAQDEGSQLIALAVGAVPGMRIVDACAGAGGKSLAMLAACPTAQVVAVEPDGERFAQLQRRLEHAGAQARCIHAPLASVDGTAMHGWADAVLLDAPCSGTGAIRREPQSRSRYRADDVTRFANKQRVLSQQALPLLKAGGRLVYATCSLLQEENEDVVAALLAAHPQLQPFPLERTLGGLAADLGAQAHQLRLWPHVHGTDGFYVAALQRVA